MAEPDLISDYLTVLRRELPGGIVAELHDGLDHTRQRYLRQGLDPAAASAAAVAEFGSPQEIITAFTCASPARTAARRLLVTGPVAGACWGAALITGRAWTWPVPAIARVLFAATLVTAIGLLLAAAFGTRYRTARYCVTAGTAGITVIDAAMLTATVTAAHSMSLPLAVAAFASAARIAYTTGTLRSLAAQ